MHYTYVVCRWSGSSLNTLKGRQSEKKRINITCWAGDREREKEGRDACFASFSKEEKGGRHFFSLSSLCLASFHLVCRGYIHICSVGEQASPIGSANKHTERTKKMLNSTANTEIDYSNPILRNTSPELMHNKGATLILDPLPLCFEIELNS